MSNLNEQLLEAAWEGNIKAMKEAIEAGADVEAYDEGGFAVIHICAGTSTELLRFALEVGCDPNLKRRDGVTALSQAVFDGSEQTAELLLKNGAKVELEDPAAGTALHRAAENGQREILNILLRYSNKTALDIFDYVARTPLIAAIQNGQYGCAEILLKAGADVNARDESRSGDSVLHHAAQMGDENAVEFLLRHGANPRIKGWMQFLPIQLAEMEGHDQVVRMLRHRTKDS